MDVATDGYHCCSHHRVGGALQSDIGPEGESTSTGTTNAQIQSLYGLDSKSCKTTTLRLKSVRVTPVVKTAFRELVVYI